jgi:hypothetical protein
VASAQRCARAAASHHWAAPFDFHFNKMAADSLRCRLSPRCVVDNEPRRELYEALIARLEEPSPALGAFRPEAVQPLNGLGARHTSHLLTREPNAADEQESHFGRK